MSTLVNNNQQPKVNENTNLKSSKFKANMYFYAMPHIPKASERARNWDRLRRSDTDTFGI